MTARATLTRVDFTSTLALIPYAPRTDKAAGLLSVLVRTVGHIAFLTVATAQMAAPAEGQQPLVPVLTEDEMLGELTHAKEHWNVHTTAGALSTGTDTILTAFGNLLDATIREFPEWDATTRARNCRDLLNRIAGLGAILDRELVGIRDSDAGSSL